MLEVNVVARKLRAWRATRPGYYQQQYRVVRLGAYPAAVTQDRARCEVNLDDWTVLSWSIDDRRDSKTRRYYKRKCCLAVATQGLSDSPDNHDGDDQEEEEPGSGSVTGPTEPSEDQQPDDEE
jgi:hypothetical protein